MNHSEPIRLIHAVLDGEATPAEVRELDRLAASDPTVRAQLADFEWLFNGLGHVPQAFPPEGLVAAVMAKVPPGRPRRQGLRQLFSQSRVLRQVSMGTRGTSPGQSTRVHRVSQPGPQPRGESMSDQQSGFFSKRTAWIGGGIAAVVAILAVSYGIDFPPRGDNTVGTIVPAQRYRAPQITGSDVKLGSPSGTQSTQTDSAAIPNGQSVNGQATDGRGVNGQDANGRGVNGQDANGRGVNGQDANGRGVNGRGVNGQDANGRGVNGQDANGQGVNGQGQRSRPTVEAQRSRRQWSRGQRSRRQWSRRQRSRRQWSRRQRSRRQWSRRQRSRRQWSRRQRSRRQWSRRQRSRRAMVKASTVEASMVKTPTVEASMVKTPTVEASMVKASTVKARTPA